MRGLISDTIAKTIASDIAKYNVLLYGAVNENMRRKSLRSNFFFVTGAANVLLFFFYTH